MLWTGPRLASRLRVGLFRGGKSTPVFVMASTATSCTSSADALPLRCHSAGLRRWNLEQLRPPQCEQVGGEQRGFVALPLPDPRYQRVSGRVGQLIEPALKRGGRRLGVETGGGNTFM